MNLPREAAIDYSNTAGAVNNFNNIPSSGISEGTVASGGPTPISSMISPREEDWHKVGMSPARFAHLSLIHI